MRPRRLDMLGGVLTARRAAGALAAYGFERFRSLS